LRRPESAALLGPLPLLCLPPINRSKPFRRTVLDFKLTPIVKVRPSNKPGLGPIQPSAHFSLSVFRADSGPFRLEYPPEEIFKPLHEGKGLKSNPLRTRFP
jgi:hypothetical protein